MSEAKSILVRVWDRLENDIKNYSADHNENGARIETSNELAAMIAAENDIINLFNTTK